MKRIMVAVLVVGSQTLSARPTYIGGEGSVSCGTYIEDRRKQDNEHQQYIYATWVRGFLTATNYSVPSKSMRTLPDAFAVLAYLDKYCRENPLKAIINGAVELDKDVKVDR